MSDLRYVIEHHPLGRWHRLRTWWLNVLHAIRTPPDKTYCIYIQVGKDDPRYETAPYSFHIDAHPMRFKFENGEYVQVSTEELAKPSTPNPNWHDA